MSPQGLEYLQLKTTHVPKSQVWVGGPALNPFSGYKLEVPTTRSFGSANLLEWLTKLRETSAQVPGLL